ncbi:MurR/RpiR family transcriptional regulator [Frigoribacterium faeni]|uniref:MurR/RpiR family transcriptional regulator n=1 Tax=Frigoribacterium faeni TaxID=145483 RepID=UPI001FADCD21|nr:MurR/RpiR family transcriptional regulator [Frigoribacterium faeni]MCJ0700601.1 MurR/RpiR family transcriptional regulator [Frigoribacterium faeni]
MSDAPAGGAGRVDPAATAPGSPAPDPAPGSAPDPAPEGIRDRIDSGYGALSPSEQRAADFILDHLDDLAVYTATEIAEQSGVSKATVSRLFRRLGFTDAQEVRDQARASRSRGVPVGSASASSDLVRHAAAEHRNLQRMLDGLADGRLERAATLIAGARRVVVAGFRNSYPVASHLRQQLVQARDDVRLAPQPGQSVGEELAGLGERDVVVLVGFRRRPAGFAGLVSALGRQGVPVVLIGDVTARAPGALRLECPVDSESPFDSYAAAMSLAALLASAVLAEHPRAGRTRVGQITSLYSDLAELE